MAKNKVYLGSKNFFTITVLSVAALFTLVMANSFLQQQTSTQSEASGVSGVSLNRCTTLSDGTHLMYAAGVKLFNGDNFTGGDRTMCVAHPLRANTWSVEKDYTLKDKDINWYDWTDNPDTDIFGEFQLKAESLKIRTLAGCKANVALYSEYGLPDHSFLVKYSIDRRGKSTPHTLSIEIPEKYDNKAKSLGLSVICDDTLAY